MPAYDVREGASGLCFCSIGQGLAAVSHVLEAFCRQVGYDVRMARTRLGQAEEVDKTAPTDGKRKGAPASIPPDGPVAQDLNRSARPDKGKQFYASIFPGNRIPVSGRFASAVGELGKTLQMPVWLLVQNGNPNIPQDSLAEESVEGFRNARDDLPKGRPIALVIYSPGGHAWAAYQIAGILRERCGSYVAVIPGWAKSAATLLALGADAILFGEDGELGPLDAQVFDLEREERMSALDEVKSLEQLYTTALEAVDRTMWLLKGRTRKKIGSLLPQALQFVSESTCPLFEKIDVVRFTQMSRALKVAEEYAIRLLRLRHLEDAGRIARHLVEHYPDHRFVIDLEEARKIGLKVEAVSEKARVPLRQMREELNKRTLLGCLKQVAAK